MVCTKELEKDVLNGIRENIVDAARNVHTILGPGLLESAYETCMTFELIDRGLKVERRKPLPVVYRKIRLDYGYRLHLLVEEAVIVEMKTVDVLLPVHEAHLLSYLKLSRCQTAILINFSAVVFTDAVRTVENDPLGMEGDE